LGKLAVFAAISGPALDAPSSRSVHQRFTSLFNTARALA
jgi:hypothetical protein